MHKKLFTIFSVLLFSSLSANAASIYITPDKATLGVNELSGATIYINSTNKSVNNVEGTITFDPSTTQIESIISNDSIISLWIEQPTFSNTTGKVTFNGGIPNPGYTGASGKIARIIFRTKKSGTGSFSFSSASVRANDGLGTDITETKNGATVAIGNQEVITPTVPSNQNTAIASAKVPSRPIITSKEMPDENSWYNLKEATFIWNVPQGVTGAQLLHGSFPNSIPQVIYNPAISKKTLPNITEGTWYLHVRFSNEQGWGETTHRKIKVDTTDPYEINVVEETQNDGSITLKLSAKDKLSGIKSYKVEIEGQEPILVTNLEKDYSASAILPTLKAGTNPIKVATYDFAGNTIEKTIEVSVKEAEIKAPVITVDKININSDETLEVKGTSDYPLETVLVWTQVENKEPEMTTVTTDSNGSFNFTFIPKGEGIVSIWTTIEKESSKQGSSSNKLTVQVTGVSESLLSLLKAEVPATVALLLLILIIILLTVIIILRRKLHVVKKNMKTDLNKTKIDVKEVFDIMKKDNLKSSKTLAKTKALTEEMAASLETTKEDLDQAEKYFTNRIKKIEIDNLE